jgi:hypothetical protein
MYIIKTKNWFWNLTIFASCKNNTTIGSTIYVESDWKQLEKWQQNSIILHERTHIAQQQANGVLKFMFLYFLCLPLFWNPWRYKWEYEAYKNEGINDFDEDSVRRLLRSWRYGWLINK